MQNIKKILPKIILFAAITIVIIVVIVSLNDITSIYEILKTVSWQWILVGIGVLFLYILLHPLSLYFLGRKQEQKISFIDSFMVGSMEYFFNGITPFSSGGQPFQVYSYNKIGIKPSQSTGMLLINFVATQTAIVFLCLTSLVYYQQLTQNKTYLQVMVIVGLVMNLFILTLFTALGLSGKIRKGLSFLVEKFCHWKIFKGKLDRFALSFDQYCQDAQTTFKALLHQKITFLICVFFKTVSLILLYMIPFIIFKALNIDISVRSLPLITAMTTFSIAMTCYIPTPGASGGIEFAFTSLFSTIAEISSSQAVSGMLLWRFLTYYLLMGISFVIYLIFERVTAHPKPEISS